MPDRVHLGNFTRAESHMYMQRRVDLGMFGRLVHRRERLTAENQTVVRANFDTVFSWGIFDLTEPASITLPETGGRYVSMIVINEDHYVKLFTYSPGTHVLDRELVGTRYAHVAIRIFGDQSDEADMAVVRSIQDRITFEQADVGSFEVPDWDEASRAAIRDHLEALTPHLSGRAMFGDRAEVDDVQHLVGAAVGWGGLPSEHVIYRSSFPDFNDGEQAAEMVVPAEMPCDAFWSVTVYNSKGYVDDKGSGIHSYNSVTAERNADGSATIRFGGDLSLPNSFPVSPGWNVTIRLYRPHDEAVNGSWRHPHPQPT